MRKEKQLLLNEIKEKIDSSESMIVTKYDKLEPNASWQLRELLTKSESQFEVVKKRILVKAADMSGVKLDEELLEGHVGVVFVSGSDAMAPTKTVVQFAADNGDLLKVLCAQIDGKMLPGAEVVELSKLPSLDEMRSILIGLLTSPMSQLLSVMEAALAGPLSVIEQKSEE